VKEYRSGDDLIVLCEKISKDCGRCKVKLKAKKEGLALCCTNSVAEFKRVVEEHKKSFSKRHSATIMFDDLLILLIFAVLLIIVFIALFTFWPSPSRKRKQEVVLWP